MSEKPVKIKATTLQPIHIGSGSTINPIEYVCLDGRYYRVDTSTAFSDEDFDRDDFSEFVMKKGQSQPYFGNFNMELGTKHALYSMDIQDTKGFGKNNTPEVFEHIKTGGKCYIPGSSIKGSILSALYWETIKKYEDKKKIKELILGGDRCWRDLKKILSKEILDEDAKNTHRNMPEFAPWLQVTDTNTIDYDQCYLGLVETKSRKGQIPFYYELIKPETNLEFEITVQGCKYSVDEIFTIVNEFYKQISTISCDISPDAGILRMLVGYGSSFRATSLYLSAKNLGFDNEYLKKYYRGNLPISEKKVFFKDQVKKEISTGKLGWLKISK